jgi:exosortase A-associated hydrolase 1
MRRMISFLCGTDRLLGTLDEGTREVGLFIVSGGNEIRSGAFGGQAALAAHMTAAGYSTFRYDRRGIGESEGQNGGFEASAEDIAAAVAAFLQTAPQVKRIVAFGNCDAATALALFHQGNPVDGLILANPWLIEAAPASDAQPTAPSATAIRARYWARLKNPRSLLDLLSGKIDLRKLASGLASAARKEPVSGLAVRMAATLAQSPVPTRILIARRDTTAMAFMGAWHSAEFAHIRSLAHIQLDQFDTASHGFADDASRLWLYESIGKALQTA